VALTPPQIERYSRQIVLPRVGGVGQLRLLSKAVSVRLDDSSQPGTAAIAYLAAAGVGRIAIAGNIQRTVTGDDVGLLLHQDDVGLPLRVAIKERVAALNPDVTVTWSPEDTDCALAPRSASRSLADALWVGGEAALLAVEQLSQGAR